MTYAMNSKERVLNALRLKPTDAVPFVETRVDPALQEALLGKGLHYPPRITGTTNLCRVEINEMLGLDNFQVRFLPPIFAGSRNATGGESYDAPWIRSREDLAKMVFPDPESPSLYHEAEAMIRAGGHRYAVGATLRSGISAVTMSMGLEGLSYALADAPDLVQTVLGRYADWAIAVSRHLKDIGVDFLWTADDMAYKTGPMFSPAAFQRVFKPRLKEFADAIKALGFPWIFHSDGNVLPLLDDLLEIGIDALHPIEPGAMDITEVKAQYGNRLCLVGNIDLHYTLTRGTTTEVEAEVRRRIETIGPGGGYMIGSANSLTSYCRLENVLAMAAAIAKYRYLPIPGPNPAGKPSFPMP